MDFNRFPDRMKSISMRRTNDEELPEHPDLVHEGSPRKDRLSSENDVRDAALVYENVGRPGFVAQIFKDAETAPAEVLERRLQDTLAQWEKIRQVRAELIREGEEGFNIPGTIRGLVSDGKVKGILKTDLSEGGKKEVIDVNSLKDNPKQISPEEWKIVRQNIVRDIEIAMGHGLKIIGSRSGLDIWVIARDKETRESKVFLSDVGKFTSKTLDPFLSKDEKWNNLSFLKQRALNNLVVLDEEIKNAWAHSTQRVVWSVNRRTE